jgi:putative membrane protein
LPRVSLLSTLGWVLAALQAAGLKRTKNETDWLPVALVPLCLPAGCFILVQVNGWKSTRTMPPKLKRFLQSWIINTLAVLVAVYIVPGIHFKDHNLLTPFVVSLVLGILNAFIRPIIMFMALPLLIFTLGLFMLVINALLLYFVGIVLQAYFRVDGFMPAFWGALIMSLVSVALNSLAGTGGSRIEFRRGRRPPDSDRGGNGPVIDV